MEKLPSKNSSHTIDKSVDKENDIITNEDDILIDSTEPFLKKPRVGKIHRWDTEKVSQLKKCLFKSKVGTHFIPSGPFQSNVR